MTKMVVSSQLREFFLNKIKDGEVDPVLIKALSSAVREIDHSISVKNRKKLVKAICTMCDLLLSDSE